MTGLLREARLSRSSLDYNVSVILANHAATDVVADVRADAYGHGLSAVVAALAEHGIRQFRVSPGISLASGLEAVIEPGDSDVELAPYGFASEFDPENESRSLKPVLTLVGEVVAVKQVQAGSAVSYGYTYRTEHDTAIALVGLGYSDGIPRLGSSTAHASHSGTQAVIAGRIAMDQFVLDLDRRSAEVGDEVTVWGDPETGVPALRDWAAISRRMRQHLTAGLGPRVIRTWNEGPQS